MGILVQKFGGTSVKSIARIKNVARLVAEAARARPVVVVVSAMGDTTDYLIKLAKQASSQPDQRELDVLLATGEQVSIALLAMALRQEGTPAVSLTGYQLGIVTESIHNKARIVDIRTERIKQQLDAGKVVVVAGFQGVTPEQEITTLGRGGSDTTAVALAAAIGAAECDIYTDVNGVYTTDPNRLPEASLLPTISYEEMLEMARAGAQVLHPRAVELARKYNVRLRVRNTFRPEHAGTAVISRAAMEIYRPVSGVTVDKDQARLAILKVPDQPGIAGTVFGALAAHRVNVDMIIQAFHEERSVNDITFTVHRGDLAAAQTTLQELQTQLGAEGILSDEDVAKVSIIGAALMDEPRIAADTFATLGEAGVNIKMISTSDIRISCIVSAGDAERAVKVIHQLFQLDAIE